MSKEREMYGIRILSNDEYNEYKGTYEEQIEELQQAKDKLQNDYQEARDRIDEFKFTIKIQQKQIDELISNIDKAIEYMETHYIDLEYTKNNIGLDNVTLEIKARSLYELLDILKGSDKDIPGFEGTLEELDNLSIRGNNDK